MLPVRVPGRTLIDPCARRVPKTRERAGSRRNRDRLMNSSTALPHPANRLVRPDPRWSIGRPFAGFSSGARGCGPDSVIGRRLDRESRRSRQESFATPAGDDLVGRRRTGGRPRGIVASPTTQPWEEREVDSPPRFVVIGRLASISGDWTPTVFYFRPPPSLCLCSAGTDGVTNLHIHPRIAARTGDHDSGNS